MFLDEKALRALIRLETPPLIRGEVVPSTTQSGLKARDEVAIHRTQRAGHTIHQPVPHAPGIVRNGRNAKACSLQTDEAERFRPETRKDEGASSLNDLVTGPGPEP